MSGAYLGTLPARVRPDQRLIHNNGEPVELPDPAGRFLAALSDNTATGIVVCSCGWAAGLGTHYRWDSTAL